MRERNIGLRGSGANESHNAGNESQAAPHTMAGEILGTHYRILGTVDTLFICFVIYLWVCCLWETEFYAQFMVVLVSDKLPRYFSSYPSIPPLVTKAD